MPGPEDRSYIDKTIAEYLAAEKLEYQRADRIAQAGRYRPGTVESITGL